MKVIMHSFYSLFFICVTSGFAVAQTNASDSTFLLSAINKLNQQYTTYIDTDGHIYNGKEYLSYDKYYMKGHQYFRASSEEEGEVFYEGFLFTKTPLLYDVVLDQIIVPEPNGSLQFKLENLKVNYFRVHDHLFIHLNKDSVSSTSIRPGFYEKIVFFNSFLCYLPLII